MDGAALTPCMPPIQLTGHDFLKSLGIALIPATAPDFFTRTLPPPSWSGRCSAQLLSLRKRHWSPNSERRGTASTLPAGFIAPCLPTNAPQPPSGEEWLHEIKHDGFRVIARKDGERVKLYSRPGNDLTYRFPLIVEALVKLRSRSCIIDGEAVACGDEGGLSGRVGPGNFTPSLSHIKQPDRYASDNRSSRMQTADLSLAFLGPHYATQ